MRQGSGIKEYNTLRSTSKKCIFFLYIDIYMFLKPKKSDMENGIIIKNVPSKNSYTAETGTKKTLFERYQNNTAIGVNYLIKRKTIFIQFFISKRSASFEKMHFLAEFSSKNASFFLTCFRTRRLCLNNLARVFTIWISDNN